jgi:uroporphyrinogen-III synthase
MKERVAITRAAPENARTAARLQKRGAIPLLAPLLDIEPLSFASDLRQAQALLFTSSNGVHAFARESKVRATPVLAVGDATAEAARALGFADVRSADGDVAALALLAQSSLDPRGGKLVHVAGARVAGDLAGALAAAGFDIERRIAYEARPVTRLPDDFADPLDIVLFHSARAAEIFVDLGAPNSETMTAVCLSAAVALAAQKTVWARVTVAPAPREDALLAAALGR